jgi:hypothetical protein
MSEHKKDHPESGILSPKEALIAGLDLHVPTMHTFGLNLDDFLSTLTTNAIVRVRALNVNRAAMREVDYNNTNRTWDTVGCVVRSGYRVLEADPSNNPLDHPVPIEHAVLIWNRWDEPARDAPLTFVYVLQFDHRWQLTDYTETLAPYITQHRRELIRQTVLEPKQVMMYPLVPVQHPMTLDFLIDKGYQLVGFQSRTGDFIIGLIHEGEREAYIESATSNYVEEESLTHAYTHEVDVWPACRAATTDAALALLKAKLATVDQANYSRYQEVLIYLRDERQAREKRLPLDHYWIFSPELQTIVDNFRADPSKNPVPEKGEDDAASVSDGQGG